MGLSKITIFLCFGTMLVSAGVHAQTSDTEGGGNFAASAARSGSSAFEKTLHDAAALIKNGKPADAYTLLQRYEFAHSGEVRFDYLLGVAALDSGKPDKATLALERVLMVDPGYAGGRMEMARAYYQLGDLQRARLEFNMVLQQNPPADARATIKRYLDAIAALDSSRQSRTSGYIEATTGYDSNVNNSTEISKIGIPLYSGSIATLNPDNVKIPDSYYGVAAGTGIIHSVDNNFGLYAGADFHLRGYNKQTRFDTADLEGRAGLIVGTPANRFRTGMLVEINTLGNSGNYKSAGFDGEWAHGFTPSNQLKLFVQYLRYRFSQPAAQVNDFNQQVIGTGWLHVLSDGKSLLSAALYYGAEQDISTIITSGTPEGGRINGALHFSGLNIGGKKYISEKVSLFVNAGMQAGNYGRDNPYFLSRRTDKRYQISLGSNWQWQKYWSLRPQLDFARNISNIVLYSYNRTDVSLTLRRDFQ